VLPESHLHLSGYLAGDACFVAMPHSSAQDIWNAIILQNANHASLGSAVLQKSVAVERFHDADKLDCASAFIYVQYSQIVYLSVLSRKTYFIMSYFFWYR